jgi:PKD repeat protein
MEKKRILLFIIALILIVSAVSATTEPKLYHPDVAASSQSSPNYVSFFATDRLSTDWWANGAAYPIWWQMGYGPGNTSYVESYCMTHMNGASYFPSTWYVQASNDNTTGWVTMDYRTGQTFGASETKKFWFQPIYFTGANQSAFRYFRFLFMQGTNDPQMTEFYFLNEGNTTPGQYPPPSLISVQNTTITCNTTTFTWTNPGSSSTMVHNQTATYQNGNAYLNVTNSTTSMTWTGLSEGTWYNFSAFTTNSYGARNSTWTNASSFTQSCMAPVTTNPSGTPTGGNVPLAVTFTGSVTGSPTTFSWNFGDGNTSNQQNPSYTYAFPGIFTVTFTASKTGSSNTTTLTNYINATVGAAPTASFSCTPTALVLGNTTVCTDASTGAPSSWLYIFGDGDYSTDENPTYLYNASGIYTVNFSASNTYGKSWQNRSAYINVSIPQTPPVTPPVAQFDCAPRIGNISLNVSCTDLSTGAYSTWNWSFGDGGTSTQQNPSHLYTAAGTYTVSLNVTTGSNFNLTVKTSFIQVGSAPPTIFPAPIAYFVANITTGNNALPVQFWDSSIFNATSWSWDFGDGNTSTAQNPEHTYSYAGAFTVTLTATNPYGSNTSTRAGYIIVNLTPYQPLPNQVPVARFTENRTAGTAPVIIQFYDQSLYNATSWSWDFGDGNTSNAMNPVNTYSYPGEFSVSLTATNPYGSNTSLMTNLININVTPYPTPTPTASPTSAPAVSSNFVGIPINGSAPLSVSFADLSSGSPDAWNWTFGDGDTSTQQNPVYTYVAAGIYTITLNVTNGWSFSTLTKTNYINVSNAVPTTPPTATPTPTTVIQTIAQFDSNKTNGMSPLPVAFYDQSQGNITEWFWSFGDGSVSTLQNPAYIYNLSGLYNVSLWINTTAGNASITKLEYIAVNDAAAPNKYLAKPVENSLAPLLAGIVLILLFTILMVRKKRI